MNLFGLWYKTSITKCRITNRRKYKTSNYKMPITKCRKLQKVELQNVELQNIESYKRWKNKRSKVTKHYKTSNYKRSNVTKGRKTVQQSKLSIRNLSLHLRNSAILRTTKTIAELRTKKVAELWLRTLKIWLPQFRNFPQSPASPLLSCPFSSAQAGLKS
jgi:hypothetical protein